MCVSVVWYQGELRVLPVDAIPYGGFQGHWYRVINGLAQGLGNGSLGSNTYSGTWRLRQ